MVAYRMGKECYLYQWSPHRRQPTRFVKYFFLSEADEEHQIITLKEVLMRVTDLSLLYKSLCISGWLTVC